MIVYNETVIVDEAIHLAWLSWMRQEYIPVVMDTGFFSDHTILNVLDSPNEGVTYCLQYFTDSREKYDEFAVNYLPRLHALHHQQFENQFVLFNTLMQTVN